ncbi:hypothetical protein [Thioalkalivibrio sp. HK1]|uniref:hypothetical protein n=1 Tax=Thioalkalivibrio sp. HK1 TaxID=1469245 RepID=UPI00046F1CFF|nr:hypothetical protein [Thioalkalivibrio sp. HK1]
MREIPQSRTRIEAFERISEWMMQAGRLVVAASGGVDSMTLAVIAHRLSRRTPTICHAISPAVPAEATARVRRYAMRENWHLRCLDAGEMNDARYLANPVNRCYYCKTNLYAAIAPMAEDAIIVSGANLDDLDDFRPGLGAAAQVGARHPWIECEVDKQAVRAIAADLGLDDLAELPAGPCLSSRIETGIAIDPRTLLAINDCEGLVRKATGADIVRCRIRRDAVVIEIDADTLAALSPAQRESCVGTITETLHSKIGLSLPGRLAPYRMGSAFLQGGSSAEAHEQNARILDPGS